MTVLEVVEFTVAGREGRKVSGSGMARAIVVGQLVANFNVSKHFQIGN